MKLKDTKLLGLPPFDSPNWVNHEFMSTNKAIIDSIKLT
ncbi:hypothetical protein NIES4101_25640 (plasmid) [Calothrix sp. NIES-4101]|nr:hypothetical protein NIES4101_25640 [Calothrix sp. NIES-4101]